MYHLLGFSGYKHIQKKGTEINEYLTLQSNYNSIHSVAKGYK